MGRTAWAAPPSCYAVTNVLEARPPSGPAPDSGLLAPRRRVGETFRCVTTLYIRTLRLIGGAKGKGELGKTAA